MDDDTSDLVVQLCTQIGMTMEDVSPVALTVAGVDVEERRASLVELDQAIGQLVALIAAARALSD